MSNEQVAQASRQKFQLREQGEGFLNLKMVSALAAFILGSVFFMPTMTDAVFGLFLLLAFMAMPEKNRLQKQLSSDRLLWYTVVFLLYLALSSLWSSKPDSDQLNKMILRMVLILTFLVVVASAVREIPGYYLQLGRYVSIGVLVSTLICLYMFYDSPPNDGRMLGINRFNNTGRAGRIIAAALPFTLAVLWLDKGLWRIVAALALVIGILGLIQTGTRSAWITAAISLALLALVTLELRPGRLAGIVGGCVMAALLIGTVVSTNRELTILIFPRGDSFRLDIWAAHWRDIVEQAPLAGWGYLTDHGVTVGRHYFRGAHNMYLSVGGHIGLPGLTLFLGLLLWISLRLFRNLNAAPARLGLCLLVAGCAMFIFNGDRLIDKVNFVWYVVWFPLAVALSFNPWADNRTSDPASR